MMKSNEELITELESERLEISKKISKLYKFIQYPIRSVSSTQYNLLVTQLSIVNSYQNVLDARIDDLKEAENE